MDLYAQDITTERLRLRCLQSSDAEWIACEIANPKVHQWLTSVPKPYAVADAIKFIETHRDEAGYRVIEHRGDCAGVVSFSRPDAPKCAPELGYWLKESAWGQGLMTEAAGALVSWQLGCEKTDIVSGWIRGNTASKNILRKLGFVDHEVVQRHAHFHGGLVTIDRVILKAS